jgi:GT2 family glycosyltransferase
MNRLAEQSRADFIFVLNPDTELDEGCLENCWRGRDRTIGFAICEARQYPREHPKRRFCQRRNQLVFGRRSADPREAFDEVGGFDDRLYFMYCEDVDLSWKLWLRAGSAFMSRMPGPAFHAGSITGKRRTRENYYSFP